MAWVRISAALAELALVAGCSSQSQVAPPSVKTLGVTNLSGGCGAFYDYVAGAEGYPTPMRAARHLFPAERGFRVRTGNSFEVVLERIEHGRRTAALRVRNHGDGWLVTESEFASDCAAHYPYPQGLDGVGHPLGTPSEGAVPALMKKPR